MKDHKKHILIVMSAAKTISLQDGKVHETGYFLGELFEPLIEIKKAGFTFDVATPNGVLPIIDKDSLRWIYWMSPAKQREKQQALQLVSELEQLKKPLKLEDFKVEMFSKYDALFIPGGHAPMSDLAESQSMAAVFQHFHETQKPTGLICHSPCALLSLKNHPWPYKDYKVSVFSTFEEKFAELFFLGGRPLYYPADELRKRGAVIANALLPFTSHIVFDRELMTGQNPYSSKSFAKAFVGFVKQK